MGNCNICKWYVNNESNYKKEDYDETEKLLKKTKESPVFCIKKINIDDTIEDFIIL